MAVGKNTVDNNNMQQLPRVCVIGAGSSGIPVVKALLDRQVPFDCFEQSSQIGGNWYFRNPNGMSAAYESLHINTDSQMMAYADYPMPPDTPDFPGHRHIFAYFNDYVKQFYLRRHITFDTEVTHAARREDGVWEVRLGSGDGEPRLYDALIVANGHHWNPRWPDPAYPGDFDGTQMHSHSYISPSEPMEFKGKKVLVVGMGNSAMDIACELARPGVAEKLYLSARTGTWVVPKYVFGVPLTRMPQLPHWLPWQLNNVLVEALVRINAGVPWKRGLPRPKHRLLQAHPTISEEIYLGIGNGDVLPRPGVERLMGEQVRFTDGSREQVDVIIWCTGYHVSFPFFAPDFISARNNDLPLWQRMIKPDVEGLYFVGLCQPLGAIMPIAEAQAKLIGEHLLGQVAFPPAQQMNQQMERERAAMLRRYRDHAARHTMQVDYARYLAGLKAVARDGRRRAGQAGSSLPVPARANASS